MLNSKPHEAAIQKWTALSKLFTLYSGKMKNRRLIDVQLF